MNIITKILLGIIIILLSSVLTVVTLRFLNTDEDTWLCENGQWVKHGNPSSVIPVTGCGIPTPTTTSTSTTTDIVENETMSIYVSFPNTLLDPDMMNCSQVFATKRTIPKTSAVARAALEELFKGPTEEETQAGYVTTIP